jgi:preprotein translocase subunit YajC
MSAFADAPLEPAYGGSMLTILAQETDASTTASPWLTIILWVAVMGALFYFLLIRPQRSRMKRHQALVSALEVGDEVQTVGGIIGTIEYMDDHTVVLQVEGGGRLRVVRRALADKMQPPPAE